MKIRKATYDDYRSLVQLIAHKDKSYITKNLLLQDLEHGMVTVIEENGKIKCASTLVFDGEYQLFYIKRLIVAKGCIGKGYAKAMVKHYIEEIGSLLACTPYENNSKMIGLLTKLGFEYRYTFLENYALFVYEKSIDK